MLPSFHIHMAGQHGLVVTAMAMGMDVAEPQGSTSGSPWPQILCQPQLNRPASQNVSRVQGWGASAALTPCWNCSPRLAARTWHGDGDRPLGVHWPGDALRVNLPRVPSPQAPAPLTRRLWSGQISSSVTG